MADVITANMLLTESEAAKILRICPRTVFSLRKTGKLKWVKIGRQVRYTFEEIKRYIRDSEVTNIEEAR